MIVKKIKEELHYYLEFDIKVDNITFMVYGVGVEVDKKVDKLRLNKIVFKDDIGEIELQGKAKSKFQRILKENISGTFSGGFAINRPFYEKVKKIII